MSNKNEEAALSLAVATMKTLLAKRSTDCASTIHLIETVLTQIQTLTRIESTSNELERAALVADLMDCLEWGVEAVAQGFYSDADDAFRELKSKLETKAKNRFAEDRRIEMQDCVRDAGAFIRSRKADAISRLHRCWQLLTLEAEQGMNPYLALRSFR